MLTTRERLKYALLGALWALGLTIIGLIFSEVMGLLFDRETNQEIAKGLYFGLVGFIVGTYYAMWVDSRISKKYRKA
jgi:hypothetical protein